MSDKKYMPSKKGITPRGIARTAWLNQPSEKYGKFSCRLVIPAKDAQPLCDALDKLAEETFEFLKGEMKPGPLKKLKLRKAYEEETDDDTGDPTGNIVFRFSENKMLGKDEKARPFAPELFDAKGKPLNPKKTFVYGGSEVKVGYILRGYKNDANEEYGVSLKLRAVQVLKLVTGGGGFKFDAEDGYSGDDEDEGSASGFKDKSGSADEAEAGDNDDF
jgi:hypothetical protein